MIAMALLRHLQYIGEERRAGIPVYLSGECSGTSTEILSEFCVTH